VAACARGSGRRGGAGSYIAAGDGAWPAVCNSTAPGAGLGCKQIARRVAAASVAARRHPVDFECG
jgi:hypothetical protein